MEQAVAFHFWIETAIHICQGPSISMVFLLDIELSTNLHQDPSKVRLPSEKSSDEDNPIWCTYPAW